MIREEKNALVLLMLFIVGAFVLYVFVLKPALREAMEPAATASTGGPDSPAPAIDPVDPILDARPKAAKRLLTARAWLRDAATGLALTGATAKVQGVLDISEPLCRDVGDGLLLVEYLPPDALFALEFRCDGYRGRVLHQLRGGAKETLELGTVALVPDRSIRGDVRDRRGAPLENVKVGAFELPEAALSDDDFERARQLAESMREPPAALVRTDADGRFRLTGLEPREYALHCLRDDLAPSVVPRMDLAYGDGRTQVTLSPGPRARARVTLDDGKPPKGALVTLLAAAMPTDGAISAAQAEIGAEGVLAIPALWPGPHYVFVGGGGAATSGFGPLLFPAENEIRITVPKGASGEGIVVDAFDLPIKGARVEVRGVLHGAMRQVATTGADGRWRKDGLAVGATRVRCTAKGYAADEQLVPVASFGAELRAVLYKGGVLVGTVTADDKPVLGSRVFVAGQDARAVTDEKGAFRIEGLSSGPLRVFCRAVGFTAMQSNVELALGREQRVDFAVARGGEVRVRVHDTADAPLAEARVGVVPLDREAVPESHSANPPKVAPEKPGKPDKPDKKPGAKPAAPDKGAPSAEVARDRPLLGGMRFAETDSSGVARCRDLTNGTRLALVASKPGYAPARGEPFVLGEEHLKRGFALTLVPGASITGVVSDDQDKPVAFARVRLESLVDDPLERLLIERARAEGVTAADGSFELADLPAGSYRLIAEAVGFRRKATAKLTLGAGERKAGVNVELSASRAVFGTVQTSEGRAVPLARVTLASKSGPGEQVEIACDHAGRFYFLAPDGRPFTLKAMAASAGAGELKVADDDSDPPFTIVIGTAGGIESR